MVRGAGFEPAVSALSERRFHRAKLPTGERARQDSNLRSPPPEGGALSNYATCAMRWLRDKGSNLNLRIQSPPSCQLDHPGKSAAGGT